MYNILIVEDEKLIRQGIRKTIERTETPIKVIFEANNGISALEVLKTEKIDIMFTDIRMPKMTGIELVNEVSKMEKPPFIVVISGYDDFSYAVEMLRQGVKEYILKPVDREQIKDVLKKLCEELIVMNEQEKDMLIIGCQQLRCFVLNQFMTDEEKDTIIKKYSETLINSSYRLGITYQNDVNEKLFCQSIVLKDVDGHTVYILTSEMDISNFKSQFEFIGLSCEKNSVEELGVAYNEAISARNCAFATGKSCVEFENVEMSETNDNFDENLMKRIAQMVGSDKITEALRILKVMTQALAQEKIEFCKFKNNMDILINETVEIYQNVISVEDVEIYVNMLKYPNINVYMEEIIGFLIEINKNIANKFDDYKNKQKIKEAIDYINANYNKDLNMAVVSNYISMNYSLFSYIFKQYTGVNFVTYLKDIRINEAKRLLTETEMKVIEIGRKVGYENDKHFMKTFKATCGVSPTAFRKNMNIKDHKEE